MGAPHKDDNIYNVGHSDHHVIIPETNEYGQYTKHSLAITYAFMMNSLNKYEASIELRCCQYAVPAGLCSEVRNDHVYVCHAIHTMAWPLWSGILTGESITWRYNYHMGSLKKVTERGVAVITAQFGIPLRVVSPIVQATTFNSSTCSRGSVFVFRV